RRMFKLIAFFQAALRYVEPDEDAIEEAGVNKDRYIRWHKRFVNIARLFGLLVGSAALAWGVVALINERDTLEPKHYYALLLSPFVGAMTGIALGAIFACLIAPSDFLRGPLGRKWLDFVGTRNILVSRFVCLIAFVIVLLFANLFVVYPFMAMQQGPKK